MTGVVDESKGEGYAMISILKIPTMKTGGGCVTGISRRKAARIVCSHE